MMQENKLTFSLSKGIIDDLPFGLVVADTSLDYIFWNKQAYQMFGIENTTDLRFKNISNLQAYSADKTKKYTIGESPLARATIGEVVFREKIFVKNTTHSNSVDIYLECSSYPILDKITNKILAGVVIFQDITKEQIMWDKLFRKVNELTDFVKEHINTDKSKDNKNEGK